LNQVAQPGAPLSFNGGTSTTNDTFSIDVGSATFNADASTGTAALELNLAGGTTATFNATQHLASLSIGPNALATMSSNGSRVLVTDALAVNPTGKLDLRDNDLIVRAGTLGTWNGSAYTGLTALVASGRASGAWNGPGITTSTATASSHTGLAIARAGDIRQLVGGVTTFDGETVDGNAILVKYTYTGDANLNGVVNYDDLAALDANFNTPGANGYAFGDFDLNGKLNGDDYAIVDSTMNVQGGIL